MKILFAIVLITFLTDTSVTDKWILPYSIVTSKSDLIVEGRIENSSLLLL